MKVNETMSTAALVAAYNALSSTPMKAWKGKKTVLIEKIEKLRSELDAKSAERSKKTAGKEDGGTIGGFVRAALGEVLYYVNADGAKVEKSDKAFPVGRAYQDILEATRKRFPKCKTNYNCVRCYAGRMREQGEFAPVHRIPSKWKNAAGIHRAESIN